MNFKDFFSIYVKNGGISSMGIELNLSLAIGCIFTLTILPIHRANGSFCLLVSSVPSVFIVRGLLLPWFDLFIETE